MNNYRKSKTGFTFIEILVYVFLLAILITVVTAFFLWTIRINTKAKTEKEISDSARRIMNTMIYELRHSNGIYTPTSVFNASPGQLSIETTLNTPENESKTYKDFYLDNENLYLKTENGQPQALNSEDVKITKLIFHHLVNATSTESIQIDLGVEYNSPASRPEFQTKIDLISSVSLRSY